MRPGETVVRVAAPDGRELAIVIGEVFTAERYLRTFQEQIDVIDFKVAVEGAFTEKAADVARGLREWSRHLKRVERRRERRGQ